MALGTLSLSVVSMNTGAHRYKEVKYRRGLFS